MAYDIRLSTNYLDHHKILKLRQACGSDAILAHQRLLLYARENRSDGIFDGMDKDDLALIIRNEITNVNERYNALETMLKLRLLDVNSEGDFCIHDWENHNKYSVDSAQKSDINRFCRLKAIAPDIYKKLKDEGVTELSKNQYEEIKRTLTNVNESSNESLTPNPTQPNPTQPKNNIKRKIKKEKVCEKPDGLFFVSDEQWNDWVQHRNEIKKPLTPLAVKQLTTKLTQFYKQGYDCNDLISTSITNGWQGIFEPKLQKTSVAKSFAQIRHEKEMNALKEFAEENHVE
jgi:hypothetical protein